MSKPIIGVLSLVLSSASSFAQNAPDSELICNAALAKDIATTVKTQEQDLFRQGNARAGAPSKRFFGSGIALVTT
jgi:hypothetical protein